MSTNKPSQSEEEFMLRQESLVKHKAAVEAGRRLADEERAKAKAAHWMKCPKCGQNLETVVYRSVSIDRCYHCNGTWLDAGELETLAGQGHDILDRVASIFRRP